VKANPRKIKMINFTRFPGIQFNTSSSVLGEDDLNRGEVPYIGKRFTDLGTSLLRGN